MATRETLESHHGTTRHGIHRGFRSFPSALKARQASAFAAINRREEEDFSTNAQECEALLAVAQRNTERNLEEEGAAIIDDECPPLPRACDTSWQRRQPSAKPPV